MRCYKRNLAVTTPQPFILPPSTKVVEFYLPSKAEMQLRAEPWERPLNRASELEAYHRVINYLTKEAGADYLPRFDAKRCWYENGLKTFRQAWNSIDGPISEHMKALGAALQRHVSNIEARKAARA